MRAVVRKRWKQANYWLDVAEEHIYTVYRINRDPQMWEPESLASLALDGLRCEDLP